MDSSVFELSRLAREDGERYPKRRFVYSNIEKFSTEKGFVGLVGPRGAGKTVILKQLHASRANTLYVSLDASKPDKDLFTLAQDATEQGISWLLLDEIHHYPGFAGELKKIFDFLDIQIICTSSSAIDLHESSYDLSRRLRIVLIPPFLFREFVYFEKNKSYAPISMEQFLGLESSRLRYGEFVHEEALFPKYLQGRNYPFTLETSDWMGLFRAVLETIIHKDLVLTGRVTIEESMEIRRMLEFIGKAQAEGISYSSCSANCGISKYRAEKYIGVLEKAFILNRLFPRGTNVMKEPKILMALPYRLLFRRYEDCLGALREDYFVETVRYLGFGCRYLKSMRGAKTPDYVVDDTVFEIGGISKGLSQFKGFDAARCLLLVQPGAVDPKRRPLMMTGFLEPRG